MSSVCFHCDGVVGKDAGCSCPECFAIYHRSCLGNGVSRPGGLLSCCSRNLLGRWPPPTLREVISGRSSESTSPVLDASNGNPDLSNVEQLLKTIMEEHTKKLEARLDSIQVKLSEHNVRSERNSTQIAEIQVDLASFKERLERLEASAAPGGSSAGVGTDCSAPSGSFDTWAAEFQERVRRAHNVMLYNVPSVPDVPDLTTIKNALKKISNLALDSVSVYRYSRPSKRSDYPPILVKFRSSQKAQRVIRNRGQLYSIEATFDHTELQRKQYMSLKETADAHNRRYPQAPKGVRYIKGTPTLVDLSDSNAPSVLPERPFGCW